MTDNKGFKRAIIIGAVAGVVISLAAAVSMDYVFSDALKGTWRDAAVKDVTRTFGPAAGQNWFVVTAVLVVVMGFLAGVGAVLGVVAAVILHRFFKFLLK